MSGRQTKTTPVRDLTTPAQLRAFMHWYPGDLAVRTTIIKGYAWVVFMYAGQDVACVNAQRLIEWAMNKEDANA